MTSSSDRLDRIEALLQQSVIASNERMTRLEHAMERDARESNERMTRLEHAMERDARESNERMTRLDHAMERDARESNERMTHLEQGLEETRQLVYSNNRFLEAFSTKIDRYADSMNNLATRIDGVIATNNQDRQESNSRLAAIQRQVAAIAKHLGVI